MQGAREQFRKVLRLVQLNQFQSARLQLREGSASNLRKDLRDVEGLYPGVSSEVQHCPPSAGFFSTAESYTAEKVRMQQLPLSTN